MQPLHLLGWISLGVGNPIGLINPSARASHLGGDLGHHTQPEAKAQSLSQPTPFILVSVQSSVTCGPYLLRNLISNPLWLSVIKKHPGLNEQRIKIPSQLPELVLVGGKKIVHFSNTCCCLQTGDKEQPPVLV